MSFFLKGVRVPHRKNTADSEPLRMAPPAKVVLPTVMHIGAPAVPVVKVADTVKIGTPVAKAGSGLSSPVYATVSGKVVAIKDMLLSNGREAPAIFIESDGEMAVDECITPPTVDSRESLIEAIRQSGVVGLGGAGFPTYVKFDVAPGRIKELIVNGAECEPYITSDSYTMTNRADDMLAAISAIKKYIGVEKVIIGIEENKQKAIESMRALAKKESAIEVKVLRPLYPQGGEKVLIYHTTGKKVPVGKLPIDVGCVVCNCTTLAAIGNYLVTGMPLVEKCVTVDGGSVKEPHNVIVPIGTPLMDIFDLCGGFSEYPAKVLYGGPMMGISVPDVNSPVLKSTNAVLALTEKESKLPKTTACIRCGSCTNSCPFGLAAAEILLAYKKKDIEKLDALMVTACMECGCCSFICPANRPLVQTNKLAKTLLRESKAKEVTSK